MAKSTREKKKVITNVSLQLAQEAAEKFAATKNKLQKIEAKMNEELDRIKSKYQGDIDTLNTELEEPVQTLQVFATEQQGNWGKKKSFELMYAVIGFRTGTPKVQKTNAKLTMEGVKDLVAKLFPNLIRTKTEIDKEAIIALRDSDDFKEIKEQCYIDVVQDETFFVEAKREEVAA